MIRETGYVPQTTFWNDFSIAECFGRNEIRETFKRAFTEWKRNYIYLTELVLVLNWKIWSWYDKDSEIADLYGKFYDKADQYAIETLKGDELTYFLKTVD